MKARIIYKDDTMPIDDIEGENLCVEVKDGIATIRDWNKNEQKALIPVSELIVIYLE